MKNIKNIIGILIGNTIYALGVTMFILPNDLITGGTTGMAIFLNSTFNIAITIFVSVFNISMFLLGWKILGKKFALTTLISSFYYPFILGILENIFKNEMMSNDTLLCVILAGLMIGLAIGIVIRCGASTGGMDEINEMIINKLDRGSTLIHGETGYKHNKYPIVLTVVSNRELTHLNNYVYDIDPDAFMIINKVNEVRGKGFTTEKKYEKK